MLSPEYVAGFFDGEGCVNFANSKQGTDPGRWTVEVNVSQSYREVLELLSTQYGGYISNMRKIVPSHSPSWLWQLSKRDCVVEFLSDIIPYLIVKRRQVELALELSRYIGNNGHQMTKDVLNERRRLVGEIVKLRPKGNRRYLRIENSGLTSQGGG